MKGIEMLANLPMQTSNVNSKKEVTSESSGGISFGQLLQQGYQKQGSIGEPKKLSKEEEKLLLQSLAHLNAFKEKLAESLKMGSSSLTQLLEKISQDENFLESLSEDLKAIFNKYFGSNINLQNFYSQNSDDAKKLEKLFENFLDHQAKKDTKILKEVEDLIASIQSILCKAGLAENVKELNYTDVDTTITNRIYGKDLLSGSFSKATKDKEAKSGLMAKTILDKISKFLNKTNDSLEKLTLKEETFTLRESLKKYLTKDIRPVDLSKRNMMRQTEGLTLNNLHTDGAEKHPMQKVVEDSLSESVVKKLVKEGFGQQDKIISGTDVKKVDTSEISDTNIDFSYTPDLADKSSTRLNGQASQVRQQMFLQPEQVFEQIVDRFTVQLRGASSEMEMLLYPEELGRVQLKLIQEDGVLTARFIVENMQIKELIEQNLSQFRNAFERDSELHWEKITVDVGHEQLGENPFGYQGQQDVDQQRRGSSSKQGFEGDFMEEELLVDLEETPKDPNRLVDYLA